MYSSFFLTPSLLLVVLVLLFYFSYLKISHLHFHFFSQSDIQIDFGAMNYEDLKGIHLFNIGFGIKCVFWAK